MGLDLQILPVTDLRTAAYNPRRDLRPGDPAYDALKRSLDRWGAVEPLVWNRRTGNLVAGHQRLKILLARGDTEVEVSVVDISLDEEKALNVALNRIEGEWDTPKLMELLGEIQTAGLDPTLTGFDHDSLSALIEGAGQGIGDALFTPLQPLPNLESSRPVTEADVAEATSAQEAQFTDRAAEARAATRDVRCPACGEEFFIST
jgi:hypothetical protein